MRFRDSIEYESQAQTKCGGRSRLTQLKDAYIYTIQYPTKKEQKDKHCRKSKIEQHEPH